MTWIQNGPQCVVNLDTGAHIYSDGPGDWRLRAPGAGVNDVVFLAHPEAALAAIGWRIFGTAIVPLAPTAAPDTPGAMTLEPVDLSQPARPGVYLAWDSVGKWWRKWSMNGGESWQFGQNKGITRAYPLPEEPQ